MLYEWQIRPFGSIRASEKIREHYEREELEQELEKEK